MSEFDDPTQEEHDEADDHEHEVAGQTGGLYGGAEDFERDPARGGEEEDEELGGEG